MFDRYRGRHRALDVGVLPAVLDHVCCVGLPIGVAVFAPAAMQACGGGVHVTDRTVGGRVFAADQATVSPCRRRTISEIQTGANGDVQPGEVG